MSEFVTAIREAIKQELAELNVSIPCFVEKYDKDNQTVDVKIACNENLNGTFIDNSKITITDIRVEFPSSSPDCFLSFPLTKGSTGVLHFSDVDLSNFFAGDAVPMDVLSNRTHDSSDCWFVPGLTQDQQTINGASDTAATLKNDEMSIELYPDGKVRISGSSTEVLTAISDYMTNATSIINSMVNDPFLIATGGGSGSFSAALKLVWETSPGIGIKNNLEQAQADLDDIKV